MKSKVNRTYGMCAGSAKQTGKFVSIGVSLTNHARYLSLGCVRFSLIYIISILLPSSAVADSSWLNSFSRWFRIKAASPISEGAERHNFERGFIEKSRIRGFWQMKEMVEKKNIRSVEDLLAELDYSILANYSLIVNSRSTQGASLTNPRVTMFSDDGKFLLAFNGSAEQKGGNTVEMIEYNDRTNRFDFSRVEFDSSGARFLDPEHANFCLNCHSTHRQDLFLARQEAHPNWDTYPDWPDRFGPSTAKMSYFGSVGSQALPSPKLDEQFKQFQVTAYSNPRYRHLLRLLDYDNAGLAEQNLRLGNLIMRGQIDKVADIFITNPLYKTYSSALNLNSLGIEEIFLNQLSPSDRDAYVDSKGARETRIIQAQARYYADKAARLSDLTGVPAQVRAHPTQAPRSPGENIVADFDSEEVAALARLIFIMEKMGISPSIINLTLEPNTFSTTQGNYNYIPELSSALQSASLTREWRARNALEEGCATALLKQE